MKKKIGEIYNIPIIVGDKNLKTKNEIHIDELANVAGSGESDSEDKIGMIYVHKKDIMAVFGFPSDGTFLNDELLELMLQLSTLPIVAFKGTPLNADKVISYSSAMSEDIAESRFTYDAWSYTALDYDRLTFGISDRGELPAWNLISGNFADAKATIDAMFPTRITEEEFYNLG